MDTNSANQFVTEKLRPVIGVKNPKPMLKEEWLMASDWTPNKMDVLKEVSIFRSKGSLLDSKRRMAFRDILDAELLNSKK